MCSLTGELSKLRCGPECSHPLWICRKRQAFQMPLLTAVVKASWDRQSLQSLAIGAISRPFALPEDGMG